MRETYSGIVTGFEPSPLRMPLKWAAIFLQPVNAIAELGAPSIIRGQVAALGYLTEEGPRSIGSAVMVGPGLLLTATHVLQELEGRRIFAFTFHEEEKMRIWSVQSWHAAQGRVEVIPGQIPRERTFDIAIASCLLVSDHSDSFPLVMPLVELTIPKPGERLWAIGFREESDARGGVRIAAYCSSGLVTDFFVEGRGNRLPGPMVEVSMDSLGGMSGGAVFNEAGRVVGVVSSSLSWAGGNSPTNVSLVWSTAISEVSAVWPEGKWPDGKAGLQIGAACGLVQLLGSAQRDDDGVVRVQLSRIEPEYLLKRVAPKYQDLLSENRKKLSEDGDDHFFYFLEKEGESHLTSLTTSLLANSFKDRRLSHALARIKRFEVECIEGGEDLEVMSLEMLEAGKLSVDATFNLRIVSVTAWLGIYDFEEHQDVFDQCRSVWEVRKEQDDVQITFGVRAYFRAGFICDPVDSECDTFTLYGLNLRT